MSNNLSIITNTARGFLASADTFKNAHTAIWEYIVNEIQYRDKKVKPKVIVKIDKERIIISGNGSGMDHQDLQNFFTLHGENQDRKRGLPGRGRFGTGKTAAFSIANRLTIDTVKNKKRYVICLTKKELKKHAASGNSIPLDSYIEKNGVRTSEPNGTTIIIDELVGSAKINKKDINEFIEQNLAYNKGAEVIVNNYTCTPSEPSFKKKYIFNSIKEGFEDLGNIDLIIKISNEPLDSIHNGIAILTNLVLQEITLSGAETKEMSKFIFGEIDCPILDDDDQEISPFSMARDLKLNANNKNVSKLYNFIGIKVEEIRKKLVEENNKLKESEEAKKLQKHADKIADHINEHFKNYKDKIKQIRMKTSDGHIGTATTSNSGNFNLDGSLTIGQELDAILNEENKIFDDFGAGERDGEKGDGDSITIDKIKSNLKEEKDEKKIAKKVNGKGKNNSSGGSKFKVEFANHGKSSPRAKFVEDEKTVYINLENSYIEKLNKEKKSDPSKDFIFINLTHEIAYTEYALALSNLLYQKQYFAQNTDLYLQEIRTIINALSQ